MGLFNNSTTPAQQAATQVQNLVNQQFQQLARSGQMGYNLIWNNRQATPQEVVSALGTNAAAVFQLAQLNISTLTSAATIGGTSAPSLPSIPVGWAVSFNDDGSAVVTQTSSSSSSSSSTGS